jgi:hypothetical protein
MDAPARLRAIKIVHTVVWAIFVACILGIPISAVWNRFDLVVWLTAAVSLEIVVLLLNSWSCPLTGVAARYTDDRRDNFDIYLPNWLARHNKVIFGCLFVAGVVFAWLRWRVGAP